LWERRAAGQVTHDVYDELGGVSGTLARYAEDVYENVLTDTQPPAARRLLLQLARPEAGGGFVRRPVRLADLDDALRSALARLVASRLVVVSRTADGAEIADLAHEALVRQWPRLGAWLADEREFRSWQEDLRVSLAWWESEDRDPGDLMRGVSLATATRWATEHPDDISPAETAYIRSSRAQETRRARILRSVVAAISVLALAAASLAVVAGQQTTQARSRLRSAAARALADDSNRFRSIDPAASLQFALAAWHHDPTSAEAYGALFSRYAGLQQVDKIFESMWEDDLEDIAASRDGSIVVFVNDHGLPSVWTGMNGDHPRRGSPRTMRRWSANPAGRTR
jgi:conflict system STAND superfamily ATPase